MRVNKQTAAAVRSKMGMVFQDSDEQLFMPTVLEDVAFGPLNMGMSSVDAVVKATWALRQVGMEHALDRAPYHLSAGEKKRVALAGVLATSPEILVLDEPTTYLDPPAQRNLVQLLRRLPQSKLIVTHDVAFASALATRAVFFENGKIAATGPVEEIVRRFDWDANYSAAEADPRLRYSAQRRL
jgi:energy-coupling factor transporter ATP-binding protein EcfA2